MLPGQGATALSSRYRRHVTTVRRLMALVAGVLAISLVATLPTAQGEQQHESRDMPFAFGSDAVEPPAEVRRSQRPTIRSVGSDQVIDVHFFRSASPYGQSDLTESFARELIAQADAWYSDVTQGTIRLRFAGMRDAPALASDPCSALKLEPVWESVQGFMPLTPGVGATGVTWITISRAAPDCGALGLGYLGAWGMWMRQVGISTPSAQDVSTFTHELGHNLGLNHSNSLGLNPTWPDDPTWSTPPGRVEYGDQVDFMGWGGAWDCAGGPCRWILGGMHAHNRNLLGGLDDSSLAYAALPVEEFAIAPAASGPVPGSGVEAVYLPWRDRSKFVIDYVPSSPGSAQDAEQGTGPGVYVRLVDSGANQGPVPYTALQGTGAFAVRGSRASSGVMLGFAAGQSVALPDGSTVEVLSTTPSMARVRVTRPADVTPPDVGALAIVGCATDPCTLPAGSALWGPRGAEYVMETADPAPLTDDVWVASASLTVNDEIITSSDRVPNGRNAGSAQDLVAGLARPVGPGTYSLRIAATDLAGNASEASATVIAPKAKPPVDKWASFNSAVRYTFPGWERIAASGPGTTYIGLTVEAQRTCKRGIDVVIDVLGKGDRVITTMRATSPPLKRKKRAFVYLTAPVSETVAFFRYRSMTCR